MTSLYRVTTELDDHGSVQTETEIVKADTAIDIAKAFLLNRFAYCEENDIDIKITCVPLVVETYIAPVCVYLESDNAVVFTGKDRDSLRTKMKKEISSNDPSLFSQANQLKEDAIQIGESVEIVSGGCENGVCNIDSTT